MDTEGIIRIFAGISLIIGAVECFAGFKIMKAMLAIWGFFIGAILGVIVGVLSQNTILGLISVIVFGVILAVLSFKFYVAGVFILTAFLSTIAIYIICQKIFIALPLGIIIGVLAIYFVKPVVIISTAISGAEVMLSSACLMMNLTESRFITSVLWIPIALLGIIVQFITTRKINGDTDMKSSFSAPDSPETFNERKYPGMQKAYRNFCIECGYELSGTTNICPRCGLRCDDK